MERFKSFTATPSINSPTNQPPWNSIHFSYQESTTSNLHLQKKWSSNSNTGHISLRSILHTLDFWISIKTPNKDRSQLPIQPNQHLPSTMGRGEIPDGNPSTCCYHFTLLPKMESNHLLWDSWVLYSCIVQSLMLCFFSVSNVSKSAWRRWWEQIVWTNFFKPRQDLKGRQGGKGFFRCLQLSSERFQRNTWTISTKIYMLFQEFGKWTF